MSDRADYGDAVSHPLVLGLAGLLAIGAPFLVAMWLGIKFHEFYWAQLAVSGAAWQYPYLVGILVGAIGAYGIHWVLRTRVVWWVVSFGAFMDTLDYPMHGENDDR